MNDNWGGCETVIVGPKHKNNLLHIKNGNAARKKQTQAYDRIERQIRQTQIKVIKIGRI